MRVFKDFIDNFRNITTPNKGQLNDGGDETRRESIFKVAVAFEEFAFNYGKYHLNETNPSTKITSQTMGELILFLLITVLLTNCLTEGSSRRRIKFIWLDASRCTKKGKARLTRSDIRLANRFFQFPLLSM